METEKLLKNHTIDVNVECPICYDFKKLQFKCSGCRWESCSECSDKWRVISNTCPHCRMEFEELEEKHHTSCPIVKIIIKTAAIFFIFYITLIFGFINYDLFGCQDDDIWCTFGFIFIYIFALFIACTYVKRILHS